MWNNIIRMTLCFLLMTGGVQTVSAQGLLNKIGKAIGKGAQTLEKVNKGLEEVTKNTPLSTKNQQKQNEGNRNVYEDNNGEYEDEPTKEKRNPKGHVSNIYKFLSENDYGGITENFAQFKTTSATKVITLDDLFSINLGYFHDGRAFVYTSSNGVLCIDTKGNIIKEWKRNEASIHFISADGADYPKFDSGRFILVEYDEKYKMYGTAVIYDKDFNVIKRIPKVSYATNFQDGVAIIHKWTGQIGFSCENAYIDINGNEILPKISALANAEKNLLMPRANRPLCEGRSAFAVPIGIMDQCLWGFRDEKGNIIAEAKYSKVQDFSNGLAAVETNENGVPKWGFIDKQGKMIIPPKYTIQPSKFDNCGLAMVINKDGLCSFINKTGETVSKTYSDITPFCNGRALYREYDNQAAGQSGKWAEHNNEDLTYLIDSKFNVVATIGVYTIGTHADNGMNLFKKGFNDIDNYKFERYAEFGTNGTFFVNGQIYLNLIGDDARSGLMSDNGDVVIGGLSGFFSEGLAPVNKTHELSRNKMYAGYVNEKGEWIIQFKENDF